MENLITFDMSAFAIGFFVCLVFHFAYLFVTDYKYDLRQDIKHLHKQLNNYQFGEIYQADEDSRLCSTCRRCGKCRVDDICKIYSVGYDSELDIHYGQVMECTKYKKKKK